MDKPGRGGGEASKENWRPLPALYEGPLTSPFAIGRGTVNPTAAQLQRRGLQNSSRGIHSQHTHESDLLQNGYGSNGVIPSQGGNELKNPFGRGRGMLPTAIQHRGGSGGTPPPPGGVAMPRDNMVTGSNGTTGVGRGFSQLRIQWIYFLLNIFILSKYFLQKLSVQLLNSSLDLRLYMHSGNQSSSYTKISFYQHPSQIANFNPKIT